MKSVVKHIDVDAGVILTERHLFNGRLHRDGEEGPAYIDRTAEGEIAEERYYWNGRLHREGGPAKVLYGIDGEACDEMYYRHGMLHRDPAEGPAWIERGRIDGIIDGEIGVAIAEFYVNGDPWVEGISPPYRPSRKRAAQSFRPLRSNAAG